MIIHVTGKQTVRQNLNRKGEQDIMYMNMTAEDAKYMLEANANLVDKLIAGLKKYWEENAEIICGGMAMMSGQIYVPSGRK